MAELVLPNNDYPSFYTEVSDQLVSLPRINQLNLPVGRR